jgi:hypothetical protein
MTVTISKHIMKTEISVQFQDVFAGVPCRYSRTGDWRKEKI